MVYQQGYEVIMFLKGGNQVINGLVGEKHRKLDQFVTLFHTLKHDKPVFWVVACLRWTKSGIIKVHFCTIFNVTNLHNKHVYQKPIFCNNYFLDKPILGWYHQEHHTLIFLDPTNFEKS
jgi:hypothetical protein